MPEQIWFKDPTNFLTQVNFLRFFPTSKMTSVEQINALVRFALYFTIILHLFHNNYKTFYILIIALIISVAMYSVDEQKRTQKQVSYENKGIAQSKTTGKVCQRPNKHNPFMNMLVSDYEEGAKRYGQEACDVEDKRVKDEMLDNFNNKLYRSTSDVFNKISDDRQFYTMPVTGIMNDQGGFAEWLYGRPSCKGGDTQQCWANASAQIMALS